MEIPMSIFSIPTTRKGAIFQVMIKRVTRRVRRNFKARSRQKTRIIFIFQPQPSSERNNEANMIPTFKEGPKSKATIKCFQGAIEECLKEFEECDFTKIFLFKHEFEGMELGLESKSEENASLEAWEIHIEVMDGGRSKLEYVEDVQGITKNSFHSHVHPASTSSSCRGLHALPRQPRDDRANSRSAQEQLPRSSGPRLRPRHDRERHWTPGRPPSRSSGGPGDRVADRARICASLQLPLCLP